MTKSLPTTFPPGTMSGSWPLTSRTTTLSSRESPKIGTKLHSPLNLAVNFIVSLLFLGSVPRGPIPLKLQKLPKRGASDYFCLHGEASPFVKPAKHQQAVPLAAAPREP